MGAMAAAPASFPQAEDCPPLYRPRNPRAAPLYQLLETHFETLKRQWEERFERRYGFGQAFWDTAAWAEGRGDIWAVDVVYK
jgi:hypothetical protein